MVRIIDKLFGIPTLNTKESVSHLRNFFYWSLTAIAGILLFLPSINFQLHIAQGDHGNNLYVFWKTLKGAIPYRDYWWVYGPLMPYYYAAFFKYLGISIQSVLWGYNFLHYASGLVFFATTKRLFPFLASFTATLFFWVALPPFEHTYNHIGGIFIILVVISALWRYLDDPRIAYLWLAAVSVGVLCLIKLNIGVCVLIALVISVWLADRVKGVPLTAHKKRFLLLTLLGLPISMVLIYWFFLKGLPATIIQQCFLVPETDPNRTTILGSLHTLAASYAHEMERHWIVGFGQILMILTAYFFYLCFRRFDRVQRQKYFLLLGVLLIFCAFLLHEFLLSGVAYRIYWIKPLEILLFFIVISVAILHLPRVIYWFSCITIVALTLNMHNLRLYNIRNIEVPFFLERAKVFTGNSPQWVQTVTLATQFLSEHLKKNEYFLALPSEQLYYFLTGKESPVRQAELGLKLSRDQEVDLIMAMETGNVKYVLISNRYYAPETGMGKFGTDYAQALGLYIRQHYAPLMAIGPVKAMPEWIEPHGVIILQRKP